MSKNFLSASQADLQKSMDDFNRQMQEEEAGRKAASLNLPYINLHNFPVDLNVLGLFDEAEAKESMSLPFFLENKDLRIGTVNPENLVLKQKIQELNTKYKITLYLISPLSFQQTAKFYAKVLKPRSAAGENVRVPADMDPAVELKKIADTTEQEKISASQFLEIIMGGGVHFGASDIHIEPEDHFVKIRYRIDGVLQDMLHVIKPQQKALSSRIKIVAKLKLNVEDVPQDGRFTFFYQNNPIDVRVSSLPSAYGEEFVLRLLINGAKNLKISDLGFRPEQEDLVRKILARPNGMLITTGPTGSGKTTSLYSFLEELNEPGVKIITLEDPVEYKLEGIIQTPVDHNHDFSFAKALRAVLRQDPDVVMVGEIRDTETAETAMQAALTGHLVLSTLHTNDAAGAIPRLLNMGIKPFVAAPALSGILAQRLVRKLCPDCKKPAQLSPAVMEKITYHLKNLPSGFKAEAGSKLHFFHGVGCPSCNGLGYRGRIGIYEIFENTESMQKLIFENASTTMYKKQAQTQGMVTMLQDGLLKALQGLTDVEEVFRVAGEM